MKAVAYIFALYALAYTATAAPTVVLPERFANSPVVVENSPQFQALAAKNKDLQKQLEAEKKAKADFTKGVDQQLRDKQTELETAQSELAKLKAQHKSSFWSIALGLLNIGTQFFLNPFGYLMKTFVSIVEGVVAIVVIFIAAKFAWHLYKSHKTPKQ